MSEAEKTAMSRTLAGPNLEVSEREIMTSMSNWRTDSYGHDRRDLYYGGLYAGYIMQWTGAGPNVGRWRGWFMSDDQGKETGWFNTPDEARASVEVVLSKALLA